MKSKLARKILKETPKKVKDKIKEYANNLVKDKFYCQRVTELKSICKEQCKECRITENNKNQSKEVCKCGFNLCYVNEMKLYCSKCNGLKDVHLET